MQRLLGWCGVLTLTSADAWSSRVLDGTLSRNGMISFSRHLKATPARRVL